MKKWLLYVHGQKYRILVENIISLAALQFINYIVPLLVIPLIFVRVGVDNFGKIIFAQAALSFIVIAVNYGFNLHATKDVAQNKNDLKELSKILSKVTIIKCIFGVSSLLGLLVGLQLAGVHGNDYLLYLFTWGMVIESILVPIWLYQGLQKAKYIVYIYAISKTVSGLMLVFYISQPSDYILVPLIYLFGYAIAGSLSIYVVRTLGLRLFPVARSSIFEYLISGWALFMSNIGANLHKSAPILMLGILLSPAAVGIYALAEKFARAIQALMSSVTEAFFPYFSGLASSAKMESTARKVMVLSKFYLLVLAFIIALAQLLILFLKDLTVMAAYKESLEIFKFLIVIASFAVVNHFIGLVGLISHNQSKFYMGAIVSAGLINCALCFLLINVFGLNGALLSAIIVEVSVFVIFYIKLNNICTFGSNE